MSCDLVRRLKHLHKEGVNGCVPDQLEEEQVLETLQADRAQGGKAQQQLGKPKGERRYGISIQCGQVLSLRKDRKNAQLCSVGCQREVPMH